MDTPKSIVLASVVIAAVMSVNFHMYREEQACATLYTEMEKDGLSNVVVTLYFQGKLKDVMAKQISYMEQMHGTTLRQCLKVS
jgi:hypothetical protein